MDRGKMERLLLSLTAGHGLVLVLVVCILITMHYASYSKIAQDQMDSRMKDTYDLAKVMVIPLWNNDLNMIRQISEAYMTCAYISGIKVDTDLGETLYDNILEASSNQLIREEKVRQSDHYFGTIRLQFTREGIDRTLRKTLIIVIIATIPLIMITIIGCHFLIKYFLKKALKPHNR